MRFCDFFISYKIGLKGIRSTIPFTKLPLYRKITAVAIFATSVTSAILFMLKLATAGFITLSLGLLSFAVFIIIDSRKRNLEIMLIDHYKPYSQQRMNMVIGILQQYEVDIHNISLINLLIDEAKNAQIQCDYLAPLKKALKTLGAIIIPIVAYVAQKIGNTASQDEMITMAAQSIAIVLMFFSLIFSLTPILKDIFYRDYNKYNELIYDLRQIKLFYTKEGTPSS